MNTDQFIENAKEQLKEALARPNANEADLQRYQAWAQGKCAVCDKALEVSNVESQPNRTAYIFACGHKYITLQCQVKVETRVSAQTSSIGLTPDGQQSIKARQSGSIKRNRETGRNEECNIAQHFARFIKPSLIKFQNDEQASPTDVIGESSDGTREYFQVTKLYTDKFWKKLYSSNAVDLITGEIVNLVKQAIDRKTHYDHRQKQKITLLIDSWPGIHAQYVERANSELGELLKQAGFKEVWLVGHTQDQIFCIWPQD